MSNLVKYEKWTAEAADEEAEEIASSGSGADFMKLKVGKNVVRFLPPLIGRKSPFRVIYQHYITLPGATSPVSFTCPRYEAKKSCPACSKADELRSTGNPADRDLAGDLFARRRVFCNVIDRSDPDKGPKILAIGKTVHEQLVELRRDEDAGGDFTDPTEDGFDIIIKREGTGKNDTKYNVVPARNRSELGNMEWIDMQHDLERFAVLPTPDELRKMLGGEPSAGAGRAAATGRPRPSGSTSKAAKAAPRRSAEDDAIDTEGEEVE